MAHPTPEDVFTPTAPVSDDMFTERRHEDLQARVGGALRERGRQVVVYGPTGVGKTSLVQYLCKQLSVGYRRVECGAAFDGLVTFALAQLVDEAIIEEVRKSTLGGEASATLWSLLGSKIQASSATETKVSKLPRNAADLLAEAMIHKKIRVLFLDNFENIFGKPHEVDTIRQVGELLQSFSDRSVDGRHDVKIVLAGIPDASAGLISLSTAVSRRTVQIEVTRMPESELGQILDRGSQKLGVIFDGPSHNRIVRDSDGFPYYTHLFALNSVRRVVGRRKPTVTWIEFDESLDAIVADCQLELRIGYQAAVETTGILKTRKSILEAMAVRNQHEMYFSEIKESFLKMHPNYTKDSLGFLNPAMQELIASRIVSATGKPKSRRRIYRFTNPLMRAFVMLQIAREERSRRLQTVIGNPDPTT